MSKPTIAQLHSKCAEDVARILSPLISESEGSPVFRVQRAPEWVQLLIWNVLVAFSVGIGANATFAGLQRLIQKNGQATRRELDEYSETLEEEPITGDAAVTFETRQLLAMTIRRMTSKSPTDSQLDAVVKLLRSHLLAEDDDSTTIE